VIIGRRRSRLDRPRSQREPWATDRGQTIGIFVVWSTVILVMLALIINGGVLFAKRRQAQRAADAGALAAAAALPVTGCTLLTACPNVGTAGTNYAITRNLTGGTAVVTPNWTSNPYKVAVDVRQNVSLFFGGLIGFGSSDVTAHAVAAAMGTVQPQSFTGIYSDTDITLSGSAIAEEPIIAGRNLIVSGGAAVRSIATLIAVGVIDPSGRISCCGGTVGTGPQTTLSANIDAAVTQAPVASTANFQIPGYGTFRIDNEWIKFTGKATGPTRFTGMTRGYGGLNSIAAPHNSGAVVDGRIPDVYSPGGCSGVANCSLATWLYAKNIYTTQYAFTKPDLDVTTMYNNAAPGPKSTNTCTGTAPVFDNNGTLNHSVTTAIVLTPTSSYDCTATAPDGSVGQIKWDNVNKVLTVRGVVFFDGNIRVNQNARYDTGSAGATIWTSGSLDPLEADLCAMAGCNSSTWDPNTNALGIVAHTYPGSTFSNCILLHAFFQGYLYADGGSSCTGQAVRVPATADFQGTIIGQSVVLSAGSTNPSPSIAHPPFGFPSTTTSTFQCCTLDE
jgi:Flp pilus assembly protein TadG